IDPVAMSSVTRELLMNAVGSLESAEAGGRILVETVDVPARHVSLRYEPGAAPNGYVRLSVHDNGAGMTEDTRGQVFEPFFTVRPSGNSVGLGLSAAWGLVVKGGGFIRVETKQGSGTSFHVYLPKPTPGTMSDSPPPQAEA